DFPLDAALDIAREAEHKAKEEYGRNAVVVTEAHGSGMIRHAGGPWEMIGLVEKFYDYFKKGHLSGKIGYDLTNVAHYMGGQVPTEARKAEVTRLLRRRTAEGLDLSTRTEIEALAEEIVRLGDSKDKNIDSTLLNWESV